MSSNTKSPVNILALAAHPDDIEFGAGPVIALESARQRFSHFVICSKGEAATHGSPAQRTREAKKSAEILGATLQFLTLNGDAHLEPNTEHAITLAAIIRKTKPAILLAPAMVKNQHPDHAALGYLALMAARLARYAGLKDRKLRDLPSHSINSLLFYAVTPEAEPKDIPPVLFDISDPKIIETWTRAMSCHQSQLKTRNYLELQLTRARLLGLRAGVQMAWPLFPNDPLLFTDLAPLNRSARAF